ncbi:hypothetical protein CYMTET_37306 [Cymbomonas tetramitiformis]|uniref:Protein DETOXIFICATION n=1 Tax=Cymbomonas tetramitiformis TaxID=36881 RepID=A0AAE0CFN9_9CHLO|nr:hypothetical protein CYMTET_37306 [Cymbomonas tetramitiformis]
MGQILERLKTWEMFSEAQTQLKLAVPVTASMLCNRFIAAASVAFVGKLDSGSDLLAAAALATTISNVTGNSICVGLSTAINTLGGQAFGAKQYHEVGFVLQRALAIMTMLLIPVTAVWCVMGELLTFIGLDEELCSAAAKYLSLLIPGLWGFAFKIAVQNYLNCQKHTRPAAYAAIAATTLHVPMNYLFIYTFDMGYLGAALAYSFSQILILACLVGYILISGLHLQTWPGWSREGLKGLRGYMALGLPGIIMLSEWWASEINIFMAGYLRNSSLQVATMSIYQTTIGMCFMFSVGLGTAVNVRVSNAVGAGNIWQAKRSSITTLALQLIVSAVLGLAVITARRWWSSVFTNDEHLIDRLVMVLVYASIYVVGDGITVTAGGVLQGCGRQAQAGRFVVMSYYLVGLPLSYLLAFPLKQGTMGLTAGGTVGTWVHCVAYCSLAARTDWEAQVESSRQRLRSSASSQQLAEMAAEDLERHAMKEASSANGEEASLLGGGDCDDDSQA